MARDDPRSRWGILGWVALFAAAVCAVGAATPAADAAKPTGSLPSLYVLSAGAGALDRVTGGGGREFELVLTEPAGDVTVFTDRPARRAGQQKLSSFVRQWNALGFRQDPPNAALVIAAAPGSRDVLVLELSRPQLGAGGERIAFRAEVVKGSATGALSKFRKRADRRVADEFGQVSLFIDPSGVAVGLSFNVTNAPPNDIFLARISNGFFAHNGTYPTSAAVTGPALAQFTDNSVLLGPTGSTPISGALQSGANLTAGAKSVKGTVENLPAGASASLVILDTGRTVPLSLGSFSVPID